MKKNYRTISMLIFFSWCLAMLTENANAQTTSPLPYCVADFDDPMADIPDAITKVSIGTLTNITPGQCAFPHYIFYNNLTAPDLSKGLSYTITVDFAVSGACGYGVWIDFNHDNIFDLVEKVCSNAAYTGLPIPTATITKSITIPATAMSGITRMRVRIVEDDNFNAINHMIEIPCNLSTSATDVMDWGETEDYNLNITGPSGIEELSAESISIFPNPSTGIFYLQFSDNQPYTIEVCNIIGEVVYGNRSSTNNTKYEIDLSKQTKGIYFVKITDSNKGIRSKKILIQ